MSYTPVSLGSTSLSAFIKQSDSLKNKKRTVVSSLYQHWIALAIYECNQTLCLDTDGAISVSIDSNFSCEVQKSSLDAFVRHIERIVKPTPEANRYTSQDDLMSSENVVSAQLAREFDHFIFGTGERGACYHQLGCRKKGRSHGSPDQPDLFILSKVDDQPSIPLLVSDVKNDNMKDALDESIAYAIACLEQCIRECTVVLALPMTRYEMKLLVCVGHNDKMICMEVCTVNISDNHALSTFLCTVYGAVHYLLNNTHTIQSRQSSCITMKCDGEHRMLATRTIYCIKENRHRVHKFYDDFEYEQCSPNVETVMTVLGNTALPNSQCVPLTTDGRFKKLEYDYIEGSCHPQNIGQICTIIRKLAKVHNQDYVHSDIREANLVFCTSGDDAYLIDFDLMRKENDNYPSGYNHFEIPERHPDAQPGSPRRKVHDSYALGVILEGTALFQYDLSDEQRKVLAELKKTDAHLVTIAERLISD